MYGCTKAHASVRDKNVRVLAFEEINSDYNKKTGTIMDFYIRENLPL